MKKRGLIVVVVLFSVLLLSLFSTSVTALGLVGDKLGDLVFVPGKMISNKYLVTETTRPVEVNVGGEIAKYVTINKMVDNQFEMIVNFPEQIDLPVGTYWLTLTANEVDDSSESAAIKSLLTVTKRFKVEVYSYEKEILASFNAPNVNEGFPLDFNIALQSRTYSKIDSVIADIIIYDLNNNIVGKTETKKEELPALISKTLTASFDTSELKVADYWAEAKINYDGKIITLNDTFKIGEMDLILKNYTAELPQGFAEFKLMVENNWGNPVKNVYAKLFIADQEMLQTPSIIIGPWGEAELSALTKIDLELGEYPAKLQLFFEDKMKEEEIQLNVVEEDKIVASKEKTRILILSLTIAGLVLILLIVIFLFYRKVKQKKDEKI